MKVRVRVKFIGREITYPELGRKMMDTVVEALQDIAQVEQPPTMEGRAMLMVLAPLTSKDKKKQPQQP